MYYRHLYNFRRHCINIAPNNTVGDLASVPDIATNYFLESLSGGYAWIGGHRDENQTDIFKWTDGTTFSFESWVVGQPNNEEEDSIYMDPAGNWLDGRGTDAKEFICQYKGIYHKNLWSLVLCLSVQSFLRESPRVSSLCRVPRVPRLAQRTMDRDRNREDRDHPLHLNFSGTGGGIADSSQYHSNDLGQKRHGKRDHYR